MTAQPHKASIGGGGLSSEEAGGQAAMTQWQLWAQESPLHVVNDTPLDATVWQRLFESQVCPVVDEDDMGKQG
jgi:hypothetical protein